jgi:hypothetical protein
LALLSFYGSTVHGYDIKLEDCRNKKEIGDVSSSDHIKQREKRRRKCIL